MGPLGIADLKHQKRARATLTYLSGDYGARDMPIGFLVLVAESGSGKYLNWVHPMSPRVNEIQGVILPPLERPFGSKA